MSKTPDAEKANSGKARIHALPRRGTRCPICRKPATAATAPFCSTRCRDVDLARWFGESYAIPAVEVDEADLDALNDTDDPEDKGA